MSFGQSIEALSSGLRGQARRLQHVSENIANADTPGYRRKTVGFHEAVSGGRRDGTLALGRVHLDRSPLERIHQPDHPMADASGYYEGSNVDLAIEVADAQAAQRAYEAGLKTFQQVRRMSSDLMDILKR
jgi:flagellar basal-body rod protein FlgC